ncbi:MAG TPA: tetratricopeptide repeat protein [Terriglobales bacterium]|nr:tetratricopeptide repeat protein [Terriglobales bacterium]
MQRFLASACLVLIVASVGSAQSVRSGRNGLDSNSTATGGVFLSGTVVIDGGDVLTDAAEIQTVCRGQRRTVTRTDSHGSFSFQFGGRETASDAGFGADTPAVEHRTGMFDRPTPQDCELQAALVGFSSDIVQLGGRVSGDESVIIGRIVLHRLANVEGFTISATTAQAPAAAKKAFEKGREQQSKGKWDEAQKLLEKAVALDPKFAVAWYELGRVQLQKNDPAAARNAFQQSVAADPKYINPYRGLVQLAQRERNWAELAEASEKLLALNPVSFPEAWFSNAISHYSQGNLGAAEKSARRGLQIDSEHRVPKLEYLLGVVLMEERGYDEAGKHIQIFLNQATQAADVAEARSKLDEITRLSTAASLALAEKK